MPSSIPLYEYTTGDYFKEGRLYGIKEISEKSFQDDERLGEEGRFERFTTKSTFRKDVRTTFKYLKEELANVFFIMGQ